MKRNKISFLFLPLFFLLLAAETPPPAPPPATTADLTLTLHSPYHAPITAKGRFYRSGLSIRYEPEGTEEFDLYDLTRREEIRLFPRDKIYFQIRLGPARLIKAIQEGWLPPPAPYKETRILLNEGSLKGRDARLYLVLLEEKEKRWHSLRWVTADASEIPLQVIYSASDYETVIAEYSALQTEPVDPDRFKPPSDFLSVNPY
ncbi:MAG: hypothetical protein HY282_05285 [Nitrospirae bacterium]|nr:hypothetical protein [Candidatus Manganitrophaceae bacterium]